MNSSTGNEATVRAIIDASQYMTLATADTNGLPWASPVWFAASGYGEFFWISDPGARHSRNIAARPQVSIVIFDSHVQPGTGQGVYIAAVAEELTGSELQGCARIFSRASEQQGGNRWSTADLQPPAPRRLYRATALELYLGNRDDQRVRLQSLSGTPGPTSAKGQTLRSPRSR